VHLTKRKGKKKKLERTKLSQKVLYCKSAVPKNVARGFLEVPQELMELHKGKKYFNNDIKTLFAFFTV